MCKTLNQKYIPPSRGYLSDTLIPAWYASEKDKLILELTEVPKLAITSDAWTSLSQNHYLTVTLHNQWHAETQGAPHQGCISISDG